MLLAHRTTTFSNTPTYLGIGLPQTHARDKAGVRSAWESVWGAPKDGR